MLIWWWTCGVYMHGYDDIAAVVLSVIVGDRKRNFWSASFLAYTIPKSLDGFWTETNTMICWIENWI